ncbi:MAG: ABC transporter permease [Chloroflexi bacterium]|nr:ABC transporter permease [Chloroflexota bacterium]MCL5274194.1 ABC transporter permease [Chloroflexota bacterium]
MENAVTSAPQLPSAVDEPVSEVGQLSQWTLIRMRFARNRLAMIGMVGLIFMYALVFLGPFVAPNEYTYQNQDYIFGGPSEFTFTGSDGSFGLFMYGTTSVLDSKAFKFIVTKDENMKLPVQLFVKGDPYTLLGVINTDVHLFGVDAASKQRVYLMGADSLGRDMFARTLIGGQISMTIGLVGVAISIVLGSVLGTTSGYFMGLADDVIQRIIEVISSFPTIPLWAALAAALPPISESFTALDRYFLITVVLSFVGWTGLARQLRAKVTAYRTSDFCQAAVAAGSTDRRIIFTHMLPNAASHIIVSAALSIPGMILGETALSFLGLGILPPMVSWGALLRDSQQVSVIIQYPWLLIPGVAVVIAVMLFSFLGDGLRDAVDPYSI